ncbi:hypothetical protein L208DRAFT_1316501, partial [Tricholoma matsutake]
CAFDDCERQLANSRGGVFCEIHQNQLGAQCHIHDCTHLKVAGTKACWSH